MEVNPSGFKSYLKACVPVIVYVIVSIVLAVIGFIYSTYYGNWKSGLWSLLWSVFCIALVAFVLTFVCNIPAETWKYGELLVWIFVLIALAMQLSAHTSFTVYTYRNTADKNYYL